MAAAAGAAEGAAPEGAAPEEGGGDGEEKAEEKAGGLACGVDWADLADGTAKPPPGLGAGPGADAAAQALAAVGLGEETPEDVDKPDASLRTGLLESSKAVEKVLAADVDPRFGEAATSFTDLGLKETLLKGIFNEMKFERPSQVQAETLPLVLNPPFPNLIAQAFTGSGKTTCFALAMLSRAEEALKEPQALCCCPTRELATQNYAVLTKMGTHCDGLRVQLLVPGMEGEGERLTAQVLVGTPGKIHQLYAMKRTLRLKQMKVVVFDEGDNLMAGGFRDSSTRLLREVRKFNKKVQVLLFSATFNDAVKDFAVRQVPNANQIFLAKEDLSLDVIKQYKVKVPSREDKATVVKERIFELADLKSGQSIIFVKTRANAAKLHAEMESEGHKCTSIHGKMEHKDRDRVVNEFREGRTRVLIATDVLSRGFDVSSVTLVVNYDIPTTESGQPDYETYVHRVGRTGRLGKKGAAFNLVCNRGDEAQLASISKYYNHGIEEVPWDSDEAFLEALKKADLSNG